MLARGIYHLDKSIEETFEDDPDESLEKRELSKAILKLSYYVCVYFVENFQYTSLIEIEKKLQEIIILVSAIKELKVYFKEAKHYRMKGQYRTEFEPLRKDFIIYIIKLLKTGILHRKFDNSELKVFFTKYFGGFVSLKKKLGL